MTRAWRASERNNEPTAAQRLYLLNSTAVQRRLERSRWLRRLIARNRTKHGTLIRRIYLTLLSRLPSPEELTLASTYFRGQKNARESAIDLAWALINTKEFLYRH